MKGFYVCAITVMAGLVCGVPLHAQEVVGQADGERSGFHFSVGAGAASMSASCPGCSVGFFSDRISGFSGVLQLGAVATPKLILGGEFLGWIKNDDPIFRRVAGLSVFIQGYPSEASGFFVKGSLGGVRAIAEDDVIIVQTDAFMSTTGIGYDIRAGENLMVTTYVNYVRSFGGETFLNGLVSPVTLSPNAVQFGAALTIH